MSKSEQYQDKLSRLFPHEYDKSTRTVTFQVTDDCNLACTYCYQINKNKHQMPFEIAVKFIDMLLSATEESNEYINPSNSNGIVIEFIGGEPLLEIDLIAKITDYFIKEMIIKNHKWATRYMISICSNGVLYFDEKVQEYIKKHISRLSFSISIDGNKELHDACRVFHDGSGSYDVAIKGVKHFREVHKGYMGSKMTLAPENIIHTFSAVKALIDSGYTEINLNCIYEEGWTNEHGKTLYYELKKLGDYLIENELYEKIYISMFEEEFFKPMDKEDNQNWCGGTGAMIAVDYKGDIYPCIRYMESSLGDTAKPVIIGNVYKGIATKDYEKDCIKCMSEVTRRSQSTEECFNCPIGSGCSWCSAYNYQETGTIDKRVTYICIMHKARALGNLYYWKNLYKIKNESKEFVNHMPKDWALEVIDNNELEILRSL